MLEEHCHHGVLVVNWLFFNSNGWNVQAPQPVTRRFSYRHNATNMHVKTIARIDDIKSIMLQSNPHNFVELKDGSVHDSNGQVVTGPFNNNGPVDIVVLHHYHQKSAKEYLQKKTRGRSDLNLTYPALLKNVELAKQGLADALTGEHIPMSYGISKDQQLIFDDSAWQFLKKHVPGYALYDTIAPMPANIYTNSSSSIPGD